MGKVAADLAAKIIDSLFKTDFVAAGAKIVSQIVKGIRSMFGDLASAAKDLAGTLRSYLPFSPAKVGPLKDLDKLNFHGMIIKSLEKARNKIKMPAFKIGSELINQVELAEGNGLSGMANRSIVLSGPFNFYGVQDTYGFMKELKSTVQKYTGRIE